MPRRSCQLGFQISLLAWVCLAITGFARAQGQDASPTPASPPERHPLPGRVRARPLPAHPRPPTDPGQSGSSQDETLTSSRTRRRAATGFPARPTSFFNGTRRFIPRTAGKTAFKAAAEDDTSKVYTLYLGYELTPTTEGFLDVESTGGHGIGAAFGLAGFTNLDVVRNPTLGEVPYVARLMLRQIIPLSDERMDEDRDEFHLATSVPARRIELRVGKFDLADFFDVNT